MHTLKEGEKEITNNQIDETKSLIPLLFRLLIQDIL